MPELPEVEVVRRGLESQIVGKTIEKVEVYHPRLLRDYSVTDFISGLQDWQIKRVERRGKFIWFTGASVSPQASSKIEAVLLHLGMSGQTLVNPQELRLDDKTAKHLRVSWYLSGNIRVDFVDQRMFGRLHPTTITKQYGREVPRELENKVAPDVLENLDYAPIVTKIRGSRRNIKTLLLDQAIASGIGNIYADEALYAAKINPYIPGSKLSKSAIVNLYREAAEVMQKALAQGGTSFDALYVDTQGNPGYFVRSLQAYGRGGQPCSSCATALVTEKISGRSSTFCPHCQHDK